MVTSSRDTTYRSTSLQDTEAMDAKTGSICLASAQLTHYLIWWECSINTTHDTSLRAQDVVGVRDRYGSRLTGYSCSEPAAAVLM